MKKVSVVLEGKITNKLAKAIGDVVFRPVEFYVNVKRSRVKNGKVVERFVKQIVLKPTKVDVEDG